MASRRTEREGSSFARKFATWAIIALIIIWAARNRHQAATIVHYIANVASRYGKHTH